MGTLFFNFETQDFKIFINIGSPTNENLYPIHDIYEIWFMSVFLYK